MTTCPIAAPKRKGSATRILANLVMVNERHRKPTCFKFLQFRLKKVSKKRQALKKQSLGSADCDVIVSPCPP